jgi:gas vesicle protein
MSKIRVAIGAVIGAAVGVVAGILTAPKSGKETRAELMEKANRAKTAAEKRAKVAMDEAAQMAEDVKGRAKAVTADLKSTAEDLQTRTGQAVEGAKKGFNTPPKKK